MCVGVVATTRTLLLTFADLQPALWRMENIDRARGSSVGRQCNSINLIAFKLLAAISILERFSLTPTASNEI